MMTRWWLLLTLPVLALVSAAVLLWPSSASAGGTDYAVQAGIAQTSQSFDTLVFDFDADGQPDFLYSPQNASSGRQLWRNNGDGTFTLATHLVGPVTTDQHGCTTADFDHNGLPDVYCAMGGIHGTRSKVNPVWLQQLDGSWQRNDASGAQDPYGRSYSASTADFNGDGWPDLFLDNFYPRPDGQPTPDRVFLNLGADPVAGTWLGFADDASSGLELEQGNRGCDFTTDLNGDGNRDVIFCGMKRVYLYEGDGKGGFTDASAAVGLPNFFAADVKLTDVNGDGIADLVYVRGPQWGIRLGTVKGTFAAAVGTHPLTAGRMLAVTDVNADGYKDVYVLQGNGAPGCLTCKTNQPDQLWIGNGKPTGFVQSSIPEVSGGSGDTVNVIGHRFIVGNGANLIAGPLQLIEWAP